MVAWHVFVWGLLGGLILEFLAVNKHRQTQFKNWPQYLRERAYWIMGIPMVLLGGVTALAYHLSGVKLTVILCLNIGASAPVIFQTATRKIPPGPPGTVDAGGGASATPQPDPAEPAAATGPTGPTAPAGPSRPAGRTGPAGT